MPQPAGSFSRRQTGQILVISKKRNSRKPASAQSHISPGVALDQKAPGKAQKATACPATSSATTSPGSLRPVRAIAAGARTTHTTLADNMIAPITIRPPHGPTPKCPKRPKSKAGGKDPQVPGAMGSHPKPKHDVSSRFIGMKQYWKAHRPSKPNQRPLFMNRKYVPKIKAYSRLDYGRAHKQTYCM